MKKTIQIPTNIEKALNKIEKTSNPVSIFVYGSWAHNEAKKHSDWEIGVLFDEGKKWTRTDLSKLHDIKKMNAYPFTIEKLNDYTIDTPFPTKIYIKDLIEGCVTVRGKDVFEKLKSPDITAADLLETSAFETGYALSALISLRDDAKIAASTLFSKSVLFGIRNLIVLTKKVYPHSFTEIYKEAKDLDIEDDFKDLVDTAMEIRNGRTPTYKEIFLNITLQNQVIRKEILSKYRDLNTVIIKGSGA